ncbi:VOC family protein [Amycolatopsis cynarae]|uniref:VOC family protein n=1 Tax=Amycolatopsis cynarae TaxID=2995223 RepID=A0ABY7AYF6_9PSEU|nr:VOC family protein [Amycolatopsis sp. HUAS 11-8]WAL64971.1 VOC family protein [Amycolatopsis sp. HUAS 11-8]
MTERTTPWPEGTPCWVDLMASDGRRAQEFYTALFGWQFADQGEEHGHYAVALVDGKATAAVGPKPPDREMPSVWQTYLAVDSADATAAKITGAGGRVLMPPEDIGQEGRMAVVADLAGAVFGLWQSRETTGAQVANEPGALTWNECMTREFEGAKSFYTNVFGYELDDMSSGEFKYAVLKVGGNVVGGLGELPPEVPAEVPPHWSTYFGVADTDATVAKATELGGKVIREPMDSPYGRMAQVTDDQGVPFCVISVGG